MNYIKNIFLAGVVSMFFLVSSAFAASSEQVEVTVKGPGGESVEGASVSLYLKEDISEFSKGVSDDSGRIKLDMPKDKEFFVIADKEDQLFGELIEDAIDKSKTYTVDEVTVGVWTWDGGSKITGGRNAKERIPYIHISPVSLKADWNTKTTEESTTTGSETKDGILQVTVRQDEDSMFVEEAKVEVYDAGTKTLFSSGTTKHDGRVNLTIPKNKEFYVLAKKGDTKFAEEIPSKIKIETVEVDGITYALWTWDGGEKIKGGFYGVERLPYIHLYGIGVKVAKDVSGHKNEDAISYLYEKGIVGGYDDGTFKPDKTLNRAELLKILIGGTGAKPSLDDYHDCYPDVKKEWFAPYVCYATDKRWVEGYPDGTFKPEKTVIKAEAIKMLVNSQGYKINIDLKFNAYSDIPAGVWFQRFVKEAFVRGLLEEKALYFPAKEMTRANISENIYRAMYIKSNGLEKYSK